VHVAIAIADGNQHNGHLHGLLLRRWNLICKLQDYWAFSHQSRGQNFGLLVLGSPLRYVARF
jgi:hypothetical protein